MPNPTHETNRAYFEATNGRLSDEVREIRYEPPTPSPPPPSTPTPKK
jgi:hypothetical protein